MIFFYLQTADFNRWVGFSALRLRISVLIIITLRVQKDCLKLSFSCFGLKFWLTEISCTLTSFETLSMLKLSIHCWKVHMTK